MCGVVCGVRVFVEETETRRKKKGTTSSSEAKCEDNIETFLISNITKLLQFFSPKYILRIFVVSSYRQEKNTSVEGNHDDTLYLLFDRFL